MHVTSVDTICTFSDINVVCLKFLNGTSLFNFGLKACVCSKLFFEKLTLIGRVQNRWKLPSGGESGRGSNSMFHTLGISLLKLVLLEMKEFYTFHMASNQNGDHTIFLEIVH